MRTHVKPSLRKPRDFDAFWAATTKELSLSSAEPEVLDRCASDIDGVVLESLRYASFRATGIHAYLLRWEDDTPRPLVVHSHGYGCLCEPQTAWAQAGCNVLGVDIRGCGRSQAAVGARSSAGYILTGIRTPETSILRGAVCDVLQSVRVAQQYLQDSVSQTVLCGTSFAGGLVLMAEAVCQVSDFLVAAVPTFGWAEGRLFFVQQGSGKEISDYLSKRPEETEDIMMVLRYFDALHFAINVHCPTLIGVGAHDLVVPAKTVYAIANHLSGPVDIMEFPVSHSDLPEQQLWEKFDEHWLSLAVHGLPKDFGGSRIEVSG